MLARIVTSQALAGRLSRWGYTRYDRGSACAGRADLMNRDAHAELCCRQEVSARPWYHQGLGHSWRCADGFQKDMDRFSTSLSRPGLGHAQSEHQRSVVASNIYWPLSSVCSFVFPSSVQTQHSLLRGAHLKVAGKGFAAKHVEFAAWHVRAGS